LCGRWTLRSKQCKTGGSAFLMPCGFHYWLQNFPLLKRLKTLLVSNNLIFRIGDDIKDSLPNVHTIMLANNSLLNLSDLKPFANLPALRRLCLIENNVTKQVRRRPNCPHI